MKRTSTQTRPAAGAIHGHTNGTAAGTILGHSIHHSRPALGSNRFLWRLQDRWYALLCLLRLARFRGCHSACPPQRPRCPLVLVHPRVGQLSFGGPGSRTGCHGSNAAPRAAAGAWDGCGPGISFLATSRTVQLLYSGWPRFRHSCCGLRRRCDSWYSRS